LSSDMCGSMLLCEAQSLLVVGHVQYKYIILYSFSDITTYIYNILYTQMYIIHVYKIITV